MGRSAPIAVLAAFFFGLFGAACAAPAQTTIGIQADRFTLNGTPGFIVFVSYFDGLRRVGRNDPPTTDVLDADLEYFTSKGVKGLRVLPNYDGAGGTPLMNSDGSLRPVELRQLHALVARAAAKGLVVDISFNWPGGMTDAAYQAGIENATRSFLGARNVLFDLANEADSNPNPYGPTVANAMAWAEYLGSQIRPAVRTIDLERILTLSFGGGGGAPDSGRVLAGDPPVTTAAFFAKAGFDVLTFHGPRDSRGNWAANTARDISTLRTDLQATPARAMPIYFQEPNRFGSTAEKDNVAAHYLTAVQNALSAGAAAWTFHVDPTRHLDGPTPFEALLTDGERAVMDSIAGIVRRGAGSQ